MHSLVLIIEVALRSEEDFSSRANRMRLSGFNFQRFTVNRELV